MLIKCLLCYVEHVKPLGPLFTSAAIKDLANDILPFWNALKRFLLANSFCNSKEYFNYRRRSIEI